MGSGNAGASNVTSELGWKYGIITGVLDVLKAFIPTYFVVFIFPNTNQEIHMMALAGTGAVLGHIYPFFLDFRGGKGVTAIISLILITIITDYVSVGSISLYIIIPILAYISDDYSIIMIRCAVVLLIVGIIKHWVNVQRLMSGTETGLRSVFNKNKTE